MKRRFLVMFGIVAVVAAGAFNINVAIKNLSMVSLAGLTLE